MSAFCPRPSSGQLTIKRLAGDAEFIGHILPVALSCRIRQTETGLGQAFAPPSGLSYVCRRYNIG